MAEWLGSALQKLLQRFESARDLDKNRSPRPFGADFLFVDVKGKLCFELNRYKQKPLSFFTMAGFVFGMKPQHLRFPAKCYAVISTLTFSTAPFIGGLIFVTRTINAFTFG